MAPPLPELADSRNKFEDLSGVNTSAYANPYDAMIEACEGNPVGYPLPTRLESLLAYHFQLLHFCARTSCCLAISMEADTSRLNSKPAIPPTAALAMLNRKPNFSPQSSRA
jgi:hypothetical protein